MTQIVHALRSNASMDYGEITEVVPWEILAHDCNQDLNADHQWHPRVFKSHETSEKVPKGARYIYVARNPLDAFYSFYQFLPSYTGLGQGDIDQQAFSDAIFAGVSQAGGIWNHYFGWWKQRNDPNVLWVFFEDMKADLNGTIRRVAAFLEIPLEGDLLDRVAAVSSYQFMSARSNLHHFDDHFVRSFVGPKMGLPEGKPPRVSKVRKDGGKVGHREKIDPAVRRRLDEKWKLILAQPTDCNDYDAFRKKMRGAS